MCRPLAARRFAAVDLQTPVTIHCLRRNYCEFRSSNTYVDFSFEPAEEATIDNEFQWQIASCPRVGTTEAGGHRPGRDCGLHHQ
jgi:hypothetical protein